MDNKEWNNEDFLWWGMMTNEMKTVKKKTSQDIPFNKKISCKKCGEEFSDIVGYVCPRIDCPMFYHTFC